MNKTTLLALTCLALGCAAGTVAKEVIVPVADAQYDGQRFEHTCRTLSGAEATAEDFQPALGNDGWQLVTYAPTNSMGRMIVCFKRDA